MPVCRIYQQGKLSVGIWKVEETVEQLRAGLLHFFMYESGYTKFSSESRKQEWLAVRVLLKELFQGEEKEIAYHPSGKPYLKDGSACISFSHTKGYVAVAVHPTAEVGVDIEQYGTRVRRVASRFVHEDEIPSIQSGDEIYALLLHWSAKETLFKLMDEQAVDFREHLRILPFTLAESGEMSAHESRTENGHDYHIYYHTHPDYVLTYACVE